MASKGKKAEGNPPGFIQIDGEEDEKEPKQKRLPGTEDNKIDKLEDLAEEYAELRDAGFENLKELQRVRKELVAAMKVNRKKVYIRNGVSLRLVEKEENVKVRVKKDKEE